MVFEMETSLLIGELFGVLEAQIGPVERAAFEIAVSDDPEFIFDGINSSQGVGSPFAPGIDDQSGGEAFTGRGRDKRVEMRF